MKYSVRVKKEEIILADECERCWGSGFYEDPERTQGKCILCDGVGYLLTTNGSTILALVRDMLRREKLL